MKEVINNHQDKNIFWRKVKNITGLAGIVLISTACKEPPQITDGTVYQKEYIKEDWALIGRRIWTSRQEIDREVISMPPTHEEIGYYDKDTVSWWFDHRNEFWKVYIAQCPTDKLPQPEKIKKECKTNSLDMPQEVYNSIRIGQHADFKQLK